jgi:hypothetical protein
MMSGKTINSISNNLASLKSLSCCNIEGLVDSDIENLLNMKGKYLTGLDISG